MLTRLVKRQAINSLSKLIKAPYSKPRDIQPINNCMSVGYSLSNIRPAADIQSLFNMGNTLKLSCNANRDNERPLINYEYNTPLTQEQKKFFISICGIFNDHKNLYNFPNGYPKGIPHSMTGFTVVCNQPGTSLIHQDPPSIMYLGTASSQNNNSTLIYYKIGSCFVPVAKRPDHLAIFLLNGCIKKSKTFNIEQAIDQYGMPRYVNNDLIPADEVLKLISLYNDMPYGSDIPVYHGTAHENGDRKVIAFWPSS